MWNILRKGFTTKKGTTAYPAQAAPEVQGCLGRPQIDLEKCNACGACVGVCPSQALVSGDGYLSLDLAQCIFCGLCSDVCSQKAISVSGEFELAAKSKGDLRQIYCLKQDAVVPEEKLEILGHELKGKINKLFGRSLHIRHMDAGSCNACDWEMNCLLNPVYDIQRFGFDFVASPRHADILLCTGPVTSHLEVALRRTYAATPSPKLVAAVGSCACGGGIYKDGYAVIGGIDKILPVDVYIPGCPPKPTAIIQGLMVVLDKMESKVKRRVYRRLK